MSFLHRLLDYEPFEFAYLYVLLVGTFQVLLVGAAALVFLPRLALSGLGEVFRTLRHFLLFNALLLAFGIRGNLVWTTFIYDRFYISRDTVVDFFPFIPFGQWALQTECGGKTGSPLHGASLWDLQGLWALVAGLVWAPSVLAYRHFTKEKVLCSLHC